MKEEFISLLMSIKREGINELLEYLENDTDFYIAPASTKYHGAYEKGLLEHSLNVYKHLILLNDTYKCLYNIDSLIIIGLLHDICKSNFYFKEQKDRKKKNNNGKYILNEKGKCLWENVESYSVNDLFPIGHGEKSVIILQKYIQLNNNEIFGIRWYMMGYDNSKNSYEGNLALTNALNLFPIISLVHMADLASISIKLPEKIFIESEENYYDMQKEMF